MKNRKGLKTFLILFLIAAVICAASCAERGGDPKRTASPATQQTADDQPIRIAGLKGPTGIGLTKLMQDGAAGKTAGSYQIMLAGSPDELTGKIISGELDVAALPTNVAAALYQKSNGKVKLAALNTLGVLYILQKGDSVNSVRDLEGKTIYATGQGAVPEYVLDYILKTNGINAKVEYLSEHSELAAAALAGRAELVMLPEPFVTTVRAKDAEFRIAIDLTQAFAEACAASDAEGTVLSMGCIVVNTAFAEKRKAAFDRFLDEYKESAEYAVSHMEETARLVAEYGIMANEAVAAQAIPHCNIVYIEGTEMKNQVEGFFRLLYDYNVSSVGGKLPEDEFYYKR